MLCLGRDANGYPAYGIDIVSERPKPKNPISELIALLQQANKREEDVLRVRKYKIPHGPVKPTRCVNPALPVDKLSEVSKES